jgi:hypothetical protein
VSTFTKGQCLQQHRQQRRSTEERRKTDAIGHGGEQDGRGLRRILAETSLAQLKTTMRMAVLHCKTVPGVLKELTVFAIVYNLVRMVILQSAMLQHTAAERISFLDALR